MTMTTHARLSDHLQVGTHTLASRLIVGTGKYANYETAYQAAVDSLESGKAKQCLDKLIALQ